MAICKSDCIERPLSSAFGRLGRFVSRNPWCFLFFPLLLAGGLGSGFIFLLDREVHGIENQFTPLNGPAKHERAFIQEHFKNNGPFSQFRLTTEGCYASVIITDQKQNDILTVDAFTEIIDLDSEIKSVNTGDTFASLCAETAGTCMSNAVLDIINYNAGEIESTKLEYPVTGHTFLGSEVGGVELKAGTSEIDSAKAIRLYYFLKEDQPNKTVRWLDAFIETVSTYKDLKTVSLSYYTSLSRDEELERSSASVIPFFAITYCLAINVAIISCLRLDCVRNKVWVASFGALSAGLAVLSSFGLLLFCGVQFPMTVTTAPFLILGIGVDDMFIMVSCWQKTKVLDEVEDRLAETYKEAAVSITITTLTDVLAFYIGLMTPFVSVQSFCLYTGTAVLFCYLYNITFFGAFLALNGRREKSNRHWLTCMVVANRKDCPNGNMCCVGGDYNESTGTEMEMPLDIFFKKYYGPFLTNSWTKVFVIFLYGGYLAASIYGCFQMQEGIDLKNLAVDDSYVVKYYDNEKYFKQYGPIVMIVITDDKFQYWNASVRENLDLCLKEFKNLPMTSENAPISWLHAYLQLPLDFNDEKIFKSNLVPFLSVSGFSQDVNFSNNQIIASRMFIQTVNISTAIDEKNMLNVFRETAEKCAKSQNPVDILVYHPAFIYFDQYAVIVSNTIQNIVVATLAMLIVSLLLIPNPLCSVWVTFAIASVIVGVAGFMALWDVNLDSISMINLVICIGFSVDFSAHISYAYVSSDEETADMRAVDALYNLGYPMLQAAVSTIAGVVVLSASQCYIFRTFFKIMFLVILFGAFHGIVILPVFLSLFGACRKMQTSIEPKNNKNHEIPSHFVNNYAFSDPRNLSLDQITYRTYQTPCSNPPAIQNPAVYPALGMSSDPDCP
ncbi:patched domain-containing protein 3-like [Brachyhypopomus gauderio]|uniref:patched domain-containing protein 3-like n=1 Tax=Brachyhypopomus gauderio TaxID=698409 RepID=UPI004042B417